MWFSSLRWAGPELSELFGQILHEVAEAERFGEGLFGEVDLEQSLVRYLFVLSASVIFHRAMLRNPGRCSASTRELGSKSSSMSSIVLCSLAFESLCSVNSYVVVRPTDQFAHCPCRPDKAPQ
jgi:hypothetical protein